MTDTTLTYPTTAALLALLAPLMSFVLSALWGRRAANGIFSIMGISLSLLFSTYVFFQVWNKEIIHIQWDWFRIGDSAFRVGILLDNLSVIMLLLIPLIALPVHIFSIAYMKHDPGIHRYWMFLSLFCAAMLGLVISDNLLLMYIFWELVGFASYLLIGYWFTKESAANANKKAFIINRIGDLGFLTGIALVYSQFGSLDIRHLFGEGGVVWHATVVGDEWISQHGSMPSVWLTVTGLAFFLGAMAKSAQFPLHVWLPDAMEGPTSVSSLIHAATMVAAGVFLLARIFPVFDEQALLFITAIGTITALAAGFFAITQNDIKKILAFSTISQLGMMMVAIGTGSIAAAIFHLVTHAFFKCLLFLSAGSVIHEMQHIREKLKLSFNPQDIRNMGGLRHHMPVTFLCMSIAAMALAGLPLTSGYLSKDVLLVHVFEWSAYQSYGPAKIIPYLLLLVSAMTTFYIARCIFKVFFGSLRVQNKTSFSIHEAPKTMTIPMMSLSLGSIFFLFSLNPISIDDLWLLKGLKSMSIAYPYLPEVHTWIPLIASAVSAIILFIAWRWYVQEQLQPREHTWIFQLSYHQGYIDKFYHIAIIRPLLTFSSYIKLFDKHIVDGTVNRTEVFVREGSKIAKWLDYHIVDGFVRLTASIAIWLGNIFRRSQTGRVQYYLYLMFVVLLFVLVYVLINQG